MRSFYHNSICTIFVYAIDDRTSFEDVEHWYNEAKESVVKECVLILVGTKKDCERKVSYEEGLALMKKLKLDMFFETSAKNGEKVYETFEAIARELIAKAVKLNNLKSSVASSNLDFDTTNKPQKGCCS